MPSIPQDIAHRDGLFGGFSPHTSRTPKPKTTLNPNFPHPFEGNKTKAMEGFLVYVEAVHAYSSAKASDFEMRGIPPPATPHLAFRSRPLHTHLKEGLGFRVSTPPPESSCLFATTPAANAAGSADGAPRSSCWMPPKYLSKPYQSPAALNTVNSTGVGFV